MEDMMKKLLLIVGLLVMAVLAAACGTSAIPEEAKTASSLEAIQAVDEPIIMMEMSGGTSGCSNIVPVEVTVNGSLSQTVARVVGSEPSSISTCFAIFNMTHGAWTHLIYIKNGSALLNLPVEVLHPYEGDTFIVGDPALMAEKLAQEALIDSDTVTVDGGLIQVTKGGEMTDLIDWAEVSGGRFVNSVRFESSRMNLGDNQRTWTGYCNGQVFTDMAEAVSCGLQGNEGW